jgi:hypothetical protein
MCCKIPEEVKAQNAFCFPIGWQFFFDPTIKVKKTSGQDLDGLVLLSPERRKYYSVEGAIKVYSKVLGQIDRLPEKFYPHVGLSPLEEEGSKRWHGEAERPDRLEEGGSNKWRKTMPDIPGEIAETNSLSTASSLDPSSVVQRHRDRPLTLEELYRRRCRGCKMCRREECQKCSSCKRNSSLTRSCKDVCLRKVSGANDFKVTIFAANLPC